MFNLFQNFIDLTHHSTQKVILSYTYPNCILSMSIDKITFKNGNLIISNDASSLTITPSDITARDSTVYITLKDSSIISITFQIKTTMIQADLKKEADYVSRLFK